MWEKLAHFQMNITLKRKKFMERNTYFVQFPTGAYGYLSDKTEDEMKRMKKNREIVNFVKK